MPNHCSILSFLRCVLSWRMSSLSHTLSSSSRQLWDPRVILHQSLSPLSNQLVLKVEKLFHSNHPSVEPWSSVTVSDPGSPTSGLTVKFSLQIEAIHSPAFHTVMFSSITVGVLKLKLHDYHYNSIDGRNDLAGLFFTTKVCQHHCVHMVNWKDSFKEIK